MRRLIIILTLVLSAAVMNAKNTSGDELMRFAGNIHQFNSIFPQEKVYLQFDNTSYYSGEVIWFKAFVVNATTLQSARSKVLYVDLLSPTGELLKQQKLKIEAGQTDGSFSLLDGKVSQAFEKRGIVGYPSGFYEIRAYTNYMLNFNPETVFSRVLAVYEKPQQEGNYYDENPIIKRHKRESWELRPMTEEPGSINCSFYPEGGHVIMGKPCRIAFKVTDDTGLGVEATGVLRNNGQTFSTLHDGMGCLTIIPQDDRNQVEITVGDKKRSFELPRPEKTGCVLTVDPCGMDSIKLKVDCTVDLVGSRLGMTLTCRGELVSFCSFDIDQPVEQTISMCDVPEGVCRIHIFDSLGNIYASRSVYHHRRDLKGPELEVTTSKQYYKPFEKVSLSFSLRDGQGNPLQNSFCLSVRDVRGQTNACADDLRTSLLISSDLKGLIENPSWYFESDDPERNQALDLLMLVQGWERYDWITMTGQKEFNGEHHVEESLEMNGWILNSSGKKTIAGIKINALLAMQTQDERIVRKYTSVTDSSGYFSIDIEPEFYGKASFGINAKARKRLIGPDARIMFERSIKPPIRSYTQKELIFESRQGGAIQSSNTNPEVIDDQPSTIINADDGLLLPDVDISDQRKYIDYFTFTAYDVGSDVEMELDKGEYTTDMMGYMIDRGYAFFNTLNEGVLINGYKPFFYIHDANSFYYAGSNANPDTKFIKSILVYDRLVTLENILKECKLMPSDMRNPLTTPFIEVQDYGYEFERELNERYLLVDILVKERKELGKKDDLFNINKRVTTVDGYSRTYQFYAPEYPDGPVFGDVDYRRTLYWNPNVITDTDGQATVEFYNNSITKHFNISAAGITPSGIPYILDEDW